MKRVYCLGLAFALSLGQANAETRDRNAVSGRPSVMANYHTWSRDCTSATGIVKPLSKPQNGTISWRVVDWSISKSRRLGRRDRCYGQPIQAVRIEYRSNPGFRGTDAFTLDVTYDGSGARFVDTYHVKVE